MTQSQAEAIVQAFGGPYVVEKADQLAADQTTIEAWSIRGPKFPGHVRIGAEGRRALESLAARMNVAFAAGREVGNADARRRQKRKAAKAR